MKIIKFHSSLLILSVLLCVILDSPANAGDVLLIDADSQFNYAEHTFSKGDYQRAVS